MKFAYARSSFDKAKYVLFSCADETGSTAKRRGASAGPAALRRVSQREIAKRDGHEVLMQEARKVITQGIFDAGDLKKDKVSDYVRSLREKNKIPLLIGGDHSITFEALRGLEEDCVLLYFDAHPDCVCSKRHYYGSVLCDASELEHIDIKKSFLIGHREPEPEELDNLARIKIHIIDVHTLAQEGTKTACEKIKKTVGKKKVYLSLDLDVIDPAHAPGVDVPCPGGPSSLMILDMLHQLSSLNIIGFDVMELSPPHDRDDMTAHLAVRCVLELLK